jgi:hypothetical protein
VEGGDHQAVNLEQKSGRASEFREDFESKKRLSSRIFEFNKSSLPPHLVIKTKCLMRSGTFRGRRSLGREIAPDRGRFVSESSFGRANYQQSTTFDPAATLKSRSENHDRVRIWGRSVPASEFKRAPSS